jgi:predicted nucleotidyltransferase
MNFDLKAHTILMVLSGSRAYGMQTEASDVDVKGVCIPPVEYRNGFLHNFEQADKPGSMSVFYDCLNDEEKALADKGDYEGSVYEIRKFFKLATDNNPNILDVLFCRDEEVRHITPLGRKLRDNRHKFLSTRCRWTFAGYAKAQLKRIETHKKWLLNPPLDVDGKPKRSDYGLADEMEIPKDQLLTAEAAVRKKVDSWEIDFDQLDPATKMYILNQMYENLTEIGITSDSKYNAAARSIGYNENFLHMLQKEREYKTAVTHWKQYNEWKQNRNEKRAELEANFGYDTKHGAHLVRLLRMCGEILETGTVTVYRPDAQELLDIRAGKWSYEKLIEFAHNEDKRMDGLFKKSKLPRKPPFEELDRLCVEMVKEMS